MAALALICLSAIDAWLMSIDLGLGEIELDPLSPPLAANLVARCLIATAIVIPLYLVKKENLLWWANLAMFGVVSWHLLVILIAPLNLTQS